MVKKYELNKRALSEKEREDLRGELWVILPFLIFAFYIFLGSFEYKIQASAVPMCIGLGTFVLAAIRLFYIFFPQYHIGEFLEKGLGGEFDSIQGEIEEETLKKYYEQQDVHKVTFLDEKKAFYTIIGSCLVFLLFGQMVGPLLVIIGTSFYYHYKDKVPILLCVVSIYFIVYVVLYKLLEAPTDFGLLMKIIKPILK